MFFVSFCLCGAMSLSVYIYENVFCLLLLFVAFWFSIFCTALWATMVVLFCAIEINELMNYKNSHILYLWSLPLNVIYLLLRRFRGG